MTRRPAVDSRSDGIEGVDGSLVDWFARVVEVDTLRRDPESAPSGRSTGSDGIDRGDGADGWAGADRGDGADSWAGADRGDGAWRGPGERFDDRSGWSFPLAGWLLAGIVALGFGLALTAVVGAGTGPGDDGGRSAVDDARSSNPPLAPAADTDPSSADPSSADSSRGGVSSGPGSSTDPDRTGPEVGGATDPAQPGTSRSPYPLGQEVEISYADPASTLGRVWRVEVIETIFGPEVMSGAEAAGTGTGGIGPAGGDPGDPAPVLVRLRMVHHAGAGQGEIDELRFELVGRSGRIYRREGEACQEAEAATDGAFRAIDDGLVLLVGEAVEGWYCWSLPADELTGVMVAVGAEPAVGLAYLALR